MFGLFMTIFSIVSMTLMGMGVLIALVSGHDELRSILVAASVGFILAMPVALAIAKKLL